MINTPVEYIEQPKYQQRPALQFLSFTGIFIGFLIIANLIAVGIATALYGLNIVMNISQGNLASPNTINALWIIQIVGTTIPLFAASVFYAYVIVKDPHNYLKPSFRFAWVLIPLVFCIMFIASPSIEFLSNINAKMVLPPFLDGLQQWMRETEDSTEKLANMMLQMNSIWAMMGDILVIGLLTAIAEEFMFRGVIQTIFAKWTKNSHAAIWITAILFSAFHVEFFGFLPRLMMGVLFGYFVVWSGSIWTSVWAHFINNGTAVVVTYLYQHKKISVSPDDTHVFNYAAYIVSLIILLFLLYVYRDITLKKMPSPGI